MKKIILKKWREVMKHFFRILIVLFLCLNCKDTTKKIAQKKANASGISCTDVSCSGIYEGPEFIDGSDIAHQFSNTMSAAVGDKLKEFYTKGSFKKVDFNNIQMTTHGMGSGHVVYYLSIPFVLVPTKCEAFTSFDHVGGWNHTPALQKRKRELSSLLMQKNELAISKLKTTPEGLQEYWIQWKNKTTQAECETIR